MELRVNELQLNTIAEDKMVVSGYVNKTNQWSQPLGTRNKFVERITPGTFKRALQRATEIQFLAEHDNNKILSSTKNGKLTLREDDKGLFMEAEITPTSWGEDYYNLIKDGIITNMSFGMAVRGQKWEKRNDGISERTINELDLFEVSAVKNPAYVQSTIAARSIEVIEDVEIPTEKAEQSELTLQEQLDVKKSNLESRKKMLSLFGQDPEIEKSIDTLEGEIRKMETVLNKQTTAITADNLEKQEDRMVTTDPGPYNNKVGYIIKKPTEIIREKAKKMDAKHSIVARTKIHVQKEGQLEVMLQDAENYDKNTFIGETQDGELNGLNATKTLIETARMATGMEYSKALLTLSERAEIEKDIEDTSISRLEDSMSYAILTGDGKMENLNADSSVSDIIETANVGAIELEDMLDLTDSLNQEYQVGANLIMHKNTLKKLRKIIPVDYLKREVDEFSGKKLYHFDGFAILVNNSIAEDRIIFGNLYHGYFTLISEGLKIVTQDNAGRKINKEYRSFDLMPTTDTTRALKGSVVYMMEAYVGGKVVNKDCFVRLDVKTA